MAHISDVPHFLTLRRRLWENRASVLVGSGFSRSAVTANPTASPPPLWGGVADALQADLYPGLSGSAPSDPLRLAEEYESTLSRDALHERLASCINDEAHEPGRNHELLLELPWSDVFTTNYDTLLERARRTSGRRYNVVRTPHGLPQASAPRIVKLHGSLPDTYPLIITEEDYRLYPQTHGAFVSLVRTRLVEHSLVMIGFSGDDPNFLRWSGWVRDHLAEDAPPLYLVTLGLSAPRRTLFEKRGIAPIDLAPAFKGHTGTTDQRHEDALRAFLCELKRGKPPAPEQWPRPHTVDVPDHVRLLSPEDDGPKAPSPFNFPQPVTAEEQASGYSEDRDPVNLIEPWRSQRQSYPGWVVAPMAARDRIWRKTRSWHGPLFQKLSTIDAPDNVRLAREFLWRLDTALVPVTGKEIETLLAVVRQYNPAPDLFSFPEALNPTDRSSSPHSPAAKPEWNWNSLREAWTEVSLSILRALRMTGEADLFQRWGEALNPLVQQSPKCVARLWYQIALHHLEHQSVSSVREIVGSNNHDALWPTTTDTFPMGEIWRSGVLAEVGDLDAAKSRLDAVLERLHRLLSRASSVALQSQERWARKLLEYVEFAIYPYGSNKGRASDFPAWDRSKEGQKEVQRRFQELSVKVEQAFPPAERNRRASFDPGRYSESHSVDGPYPFTKHKYGIACLRMHEVSGIPLYVGNMQIDARIVARACKWARPYLPFVSYTASLRSSTKHTSDSFSRHRISGLAEDDLKTLCDITRKGYERAALLNNERRKKSSRPKVLLDIYSRLAIGSESLATDALDRAVEIAMRARPEHYWANYDGLGDLIKRAAEGASDDHLVGRISDLLCVPLGGRDLKTGGGLDLWFEPFRNLRGVSLEGADLSTAPIDSLVLALEGKGSVPEGSDPEKERPMSQSWAATRLQYLYVNGGLSPGVCDQLAEAYWSLGDSGQVPVLPWTLVGFALSMPEPPSGDSSRERVRHVLLKSIAKPVGADRDHHLEGVQLLSSLRGATAGLFWEDAEAKLPRRIRWTSEEASQVLEFIGRYWTSKRGEYRKAVERESQIPPSFISQVAQAERAIGPIASVLADVVAPFLDPGETGDKEKLLKILQQLKEEGFATALAFPSLILLGEDPQTSKQQIREALGSTREKDVEHAARAIYRWCAFFDAGDISVSPSDLVRELSWHVATQRRPGLANCTTIVSRIVEKFDTQITSETVRLSLDGLSLLVGSTEPPSEEDAWTAPEMPELKLDRRPERAAAARLAAALYCWCQERGTPVPREVDRWRKISEGSNLPEVRRAWD